MVFVKVSIHNANHQKVRFDHVDPPDPNSYRPIAVGLVRAHSIARPWVPISSPIDTYGLSLAIFELIYLAPKALLFTCSSLCPFDPDTMTNTALKLPLRRAAKTAGFMCVENLPLRWTWMAGFIFQLGYNQVHESSKRSLNHHDAQGGEMCDCKTYRLRLTIFWNGLQFWKL